MCATKAYWQVDTARLARDLREAARAARTEEDLKLRAEPLLQRAFREVGADVESREYEKSTRLSAKRMDAVYGYLVIEYKAPDKLDSPRAREETVKQVESYLNEEAGRHGKDSETFLEKAVGVAFDGASIIFIRYSRRAHILPTPVPVRSRPGDLFPHQAPRRGFQVQGPFRIDRESLASLLIYVRSAARRPLTAEGLASVFGPGTEVARIAVAELYSGVMRGVTDRHIGATS